MATKTAKKNNKTGLDKFKAMSEKWNNQALQFSENLVEETLATGADWQKVFAKALKNGIVLLEKQQDLTFDTLESVKEQIFRSNDRFRKLISFQKEAKKAEEKATSKKAVKPSKSVKAKNATQKSTPKAATEKSDLKVIEGIGPKLESILNEAGIFTFDQMAKAKPAQLKAILEAAGPRYKMHNPTTWGKQAKLAAAGKMEELKTLQAELKGGRPTK